MNLIKFNPDALLKYQEIVSSEEMNSEGQADLYPQILKELPKDIETILDIGCGSGYFMKLVDKKITGISLNEKQIDELKNNGYDARLMDMHFMDFPDKTFDLVFAKDVLEHSISPFVALYEFKRVAKKYVMILIPVNGETWDCSCYHFINLTDNQLKNLTQKVGLKEIKRFGIYRFNKLFLRGFLYEI